MIIYLLMRPFWSDPIWLPKIVLPLTFFFRSESRRWASSVCRSKSKRWKTEIQEINRRWPLNWFKDWIEWRLMGKFSDLSSSAWGLRNWLSKISPLMNVINFSLSKKSLSPILSQSIHRLVFNPTTKKKKSHGSAIIPKALGMKIGMNSFETKNFLPSIKSVPIKLSSFIPLCATCRRSTPTWLFFLCVKQKKKIKHKFQKSR